LFLRTLVAAESGDSRRRILETLDQVESLAESVSSIEKLQEKLSHKPFDLVVLDRGLMTSFDAKFVSALRERLDPPDVIVLGERDDAELRAELLAAGAYAVLSRELPDELFHEAFSTLAQRQLEEAQARLREVPDEDYTLGEYATTSPAMREFLKTARRVARHDSTLLVLGETGTGKGLLARSLHNEGPRAQAPFIGMNCAALPETLLEAQLFGHERGAYTGADRARRGFFELAHGGTLFMDEVGEMPLHLQVRLLRVLEEREVRPLGSEKPTKIDVRVIAATNRDLNVEVEEKRFRPDLFYRLNVVTLTLPALRDRKEDIPEIAQSYVEHFRARTGSDVKGISEEAMSALLAYPWPGNIRELSNAIERATIMSLGEEIRLEDLPMDVQETTPETITNLTAEEARDADPGWIDRPWAEVRRQVIEEAEMRYLTGLLRDTQGKVGDAATRAAMDPRSLYQKMKKYGLRKEDFRGE